MAQFKEQLPNGQITIGQHDINGMYCASFKDIYGLTQCAITALTMAEIKEWISETKLPTLF